MDDGYTYNANDDAIARWHASFTSREGDGRGDCEETYLGAVTSAAACKAGGAFLDIGSGYGRIIDLVKPYAATLIGLEPDRERFSDCHRHLRNVAHVEVLNVTSGRFREMKPDLRFDFISVSMVVQHVSTGTCQHILSDVRDFLSPNGVGIIATTQFFEERFTYQMDSSPRPAAEYDRYADDFQNQDKGIPVRMFSKGSFLAAIEQAGLETVTWQQFAYVRPESADGIAGLYSATADQLRNVGISQYALVRRPPPA